MAPNYDELDELKWVRRADLSSEIQTDAARYTAWLKEAVAQLAIHSPS